MSSNRIWKLKHKDGTLEEFIDIRRLVGNRVIRAYLLKDILDSEYVQYLEASLRTPKDEFKDFDKFLIVEATVNGFQFRILVESGVYENLRIVATNNVDVMNIDPDDLINMFVEALNKPSEYNLILILSPETRVKS